MWWSEGLEATQRPGQEQQQQQQQSGEARQLGPWGWAISLRMVTQTRVANLFLTGLIDRRVPLVSQSLPAECGREDVFGHWG